MARIQLHGDIQEIAHAVIDLLISAAQMSNPTANTSPPTPSSPSPHLNRGGAHATPAPASLVPYTADQLIRMKIVMRETDHPARTRESWGGSEIRNFEKTNAELLGRNDKSVRFMFHPPGWTVD